MTEGFVFSVQTGKPVDNSLLTGYKTHVSCNKTSMSSDKNAELLNDVTCRTT